VMIAGVMTKILIQHLLDARWDHCPTPACWVEPNYSFEDTDQCQAFANMLKDGEFTD
jgi:hypothetical protein